MVRIKTIMGAVLISVCLALPADAQEMELVSSTLHYNPYYSIGKVGDYVYCGGGGGIHIFDIADPADPALVRICDFPGIYRMFIDGNYVFLLTITVSNEIPHLRVLEISDPLNPQSINEFNMVDGFYNNSFEFYNSTIYIYQDRGDTLNQCRIRVIDVSDPYNPILSDSLTVGAWIPSMWASDGHLHILTSDFDFWYNHWRIYSLTDPTHPNLVYYEDFGLYDFFDKVFAYSDYVYLYFLSYTHIYDISNPYNPLLLRIDSTGNFPELLSIHDTIGYAGTNHGIATYNMSNPVYPVQMGYAITSSESYSFHYAGDTCFTSTIISHDDYSSKFNIIDFTELYNPAVIGEHWTAGKSYDVQLRGDYAYIANGSSGLTVVDLANPEEPVIVETFEVPTIAKDLFIDDNRLYLLSGYSRFSIYDIIEDSQLVRLSYFDNNYAKTSNFFVDGDYVYLTEGLTNNPSDGYVLIVDISDPANPFAIDTMGYFLHPYSVVVDSGYAYLTTYYDFRIYDVSNLDSISLVSSNPYRNRGYQIAVEYPYLYMACSNTTLEIYNISDPSNPDFIGEYGSLYASNITVYQDHAFLKGGDNLYLMDISNPESPELLSIYSPTKAWYSEEVSVRDDYIYDAAYNYFQILRLTPTGIEEVSTLNLGDFSLPQNYPNPFNASTIISYSLPRPTDIRIEIFDILGRRVETLFSGPQQAGEHAVNWRPGDISSGVYYYRIGSEDFGQSRSCLLVK
jgi:hypothetical protein